MGQKVHPTIFRMGILYEANSKWFSKKDYAQNLKQDVQIRKFLEKKLAEGGISKIEIRRSAKEIEIIVHTSRPGVIIGRGGTNVEDLKKEIKKKYFGSKKLVICLNIQEVTKPDLDAQLVAQNVIAQLEKRVPFRKAVKRVIEQVKRAGAKGVRVIVSGRLNGAEIARRETFTEGNLPLHTIRADIDYARGAAHTIYGLIGVKVWIYKGEIFSKEKQEEEKMSFSLDREPASVSASAKATADKKAAAGKNAKK